MDLEALKGDMAQVLNRHGADDWANTPDYILANFLVGILASYQYALDLNMGWHQWPSLGEVLRVRLDRPVTDN